MRLTATLPARSCRSRSLTTALAQSWRPPAPNERCPSKWGADDERGAANHVTPANVLRAVRLIRTGRDRRAGPRAVERHAVCRAATIRSLHQAHERPARREQAHEQRGVRRDRAWAGRHAVRHVLASGHRRQPVQLRADRGHRHPHRLHETGRREHRRARHARRPGGHRRSERRRDAGGRSRDQRRRNRGGARAAST